MYENNISEEEGIWAVYGKFTKKKLRK
jgi:hypothetical protein